MASWLQQRLKEAEGLLQAVDQTVKDVSRGTGPRGTDGGEGPTQARGLSGLLAPGRTSDVGSPERARSHVRTNSRSSSSGFPGTGGLPRQAGTQLPSAGPPPAEHSPNASPSPPERVSNVAPTEMTWEQVSDTGSSLRDTGGGGVPPATSHVPGQGPKDPRSLPLSEEGTASGSGSGRPSPRSPVVGGGGPEAVVPLGAVTTSEEASDGGEADRAMQAAEQESGGWEEEPLDVLDGGGVQSAGPHMIDSHPESPRAWEQQVQPGAASSTDGSSPTAGAAATTRFEEGDATALAAAFDDGVGPGPTFPGDSVAAAEPGTVDATAEPVPSGVEELTVAERTMPDPTGSADVSHGDGPHDRNLPEEEDQLRTELKLDQPGHAPVVVKGILDDVTPVSSVPTEPPSLPTDEPLQPPQQRQPAPLPPMESDTAATDMSTSAALAPDRSITTDAAAMTAAAREARLLRIIEALKGRLAAARAENEALEEELSRADDSARGRHGQLSALEDRAAGLEAALASAEARRLHEAEVAAAELAQARDEASSATSRAAELESALVGLRQASERRAVEREASEGAATASLRAEVEAALSSLDEERAARIAERRAASRREQAAESRAAEAAAAAAALQRTLDERAAAISALEERCTVAETEAERVLLELRAATSSNGHLSSRGDGEGGDATADNSAMTNERLAALQSKMEDLEASLATAEAGREAAEATAREAEQAELAMRAELAEARGALARARSRGDAAELERRLHQASELLVAKQAQLERLGAERAALALSLERGAGTASSTGGLNARRRDYVGGGEHGPGGALSPGMEDVVPLESLGGYRRLAQHRRLGGAVKFGAAYVDAGTREVVRILRNYPAGRLVVAAYLIFVHLMIYALLHRLQRRAFESGGRGLAGHDLASLAAASHRDQIGT